MRVRRFPTGRLSPALIVSCLALFVALSGSALALQGLNSVKSDDIAPQAVKRSDIAANAINGAKVLNDSLTGDDIEEAALAGRRPSGPAGGDLTGTFPNPLIGPNSIGADEFAKDAVAAPDLAPITTVQRTSGPIAGGTSGSAFIQCPPGTQVVGGGGQASANFVYIELSRKSGDNGWRYDAYNAGGLTPTVTVFAYCLG